MDKPQWTKADQRTANALKTGEASGLELVWKRRVRNNQSGEPTENEVNAYLDKQLARTPEERQRAREQSYKHRDQSTSWGGRLAWVIGAVVLGVGIWQGWWPLWVIGGLMVATPILVKGSNVRDGEVKAQARQEFQRWEEALLDERARSAPSHPPHV